jgi:hypothetical protein
LKQTSRCRETETRPQEQRVWTSVLRLFSCDPVTITYQSFIDFYNR